MLMIVFVDSAIFPVDDFDEKISVAANAKTSKLNRNLGGDAHSRPLVVKSPPKFLQFEHTNIITIYVD